MMFFFLSKSDPLRWALILFKGNDLPRLPKSKPKFRFGKEEGVRIRAAFAAFTQTANAELSELLLTWLGWRDSNPLYRSQSPVCYHYTTSQYRRRNPAERGRHSRPLVCKWGGIWGSNPRHPEPQSGALPTELIPPYLSARQAARPIKTQSKALKLFSCCTLRREAISKLTHPVFFKIKAQQSGFDFGRKNEGAERSFRRPRRKRSGASLF